MAGEWLKVPAGDLFSYIAKGIPPVYAESNSDNAICVLNQKCNRNFEISFEDSRLHDISKRDVPREKILKENDIIINSTGKGTAGRVAQIFDIDFPITVDGHMIIIRANEKIDPWYLGYALKMQQPLIEQLAEGSTGQTELNRQRLSSEILVDYPKDLHEQRIIAELFFAIDSRLYVNRMISDHLEEIARAIFKHWFIDFEFPNENGDPYKSSGGEMIDSPLGPIPVGWRVGFINDIEFEIVPGDWGKGELSERYSSPVRCIRGADIREISSGGIGNPPLRYIKPLSAEVKSLRDTDVVVEISGGSPTQQTGRAMRIIEPITKKFAENLICSNFCKLLRFRNIEDSEFTYFLLDNLYRREIMFQYENGTTGIKNLDFKNLFSTEQVVIPNRKVLQQFAGYSRQIDSMIQLNGIQNMMLSRIRDSLLPKLMSGEIRVPVSDKKVDQF